MEDLSNDLLGLVEVLVVPLVDHPEDVEIAAVEEDGDRILIEITVNEEDAGKVIGRQGRVIKAMRTLTRACASRQGVSVDVELVD